MGEGKSATSQKPSKLTPFVQQKISAWQPVLAPRWMIIGLLLIGLVFVATGGVLIHVAQSVTECKLTYEDPANELCVASGCPISVLVDSNHCSGPVSNDADGVYLDPPIFVYYHLTNFYQNHRRYVMSRSAPQLAGNIILDLDQLSACEPALIAEDGYRILVPCGLVARSVFNDTYTMADINGNPYELHEQVQDIIWPSSYADMYKNPQETSGPALMKLDQWLNDTIFPGKIENAHFMSWMRNAALPNFRKMYARIDQKLYFTVNVTVMNRYPVKAFSGEKSIIFATSSWLGGRSPFLGASYCTVGGVLFLVGLVFAFKNKRNPRILGDVRFLKWSKGGKA